MYACMTPMRYICASLMQLNTCCMCDQILSLCMHFYTGHYECSEPCLECSYQESFLQAQCSWRLENLYCVCSFISFLSRKLFYISPALKLEDVQNFFNPILVHASQLKAAYSSRNLKDLKVPSLIVCCTQYCLTAYCNCSYYFSGVL